VDAVATEPVAQPAVEAAAEPSPAPDQAAAVLELGLEPGASHGFLGDVQL
jgi:hypothetical protein